MTQAEIKAEFQRSWANTWWKAGGKHTCQICTGGGKTRLAIMIIKALKKNYGEDFKVLIITPTEVIRDKTWPTEFQKWKETGLLKYCTIECIQTVYKWEGKHFNLVVADEIHNYLSDQEYTNVFYKNTYDRLLGLSARVPDNKLDVLNFIAPICLTLSLQEAVENKLISSFRIVNVPIPFTQAEQFEYNKIERNYHYYEKVLGGKFKAFSTAKQWAVEKGNILLRDGSIQKKSTIAGIYQSLIQKRKKLLYNATNKIVYANTILDAYVERAIIFSESKLFADSLTTSREEKQDTVSYHSGLTDKDRIINLKKFTDSRTKVRYLSSVKALNEGLDVKSVFLGIIASGNSTEKDLIQRTGRAVRYEEGKVATIYQFYVPNTQEEKWVNNRLKDIDPLFVIWLDSITELKQFIYEGNENQEISTVTINS